MKPISPTYRALLFHFLGDASLSRSERGVGTVLILSAQAPWKYWSGWRPINWGKMALLSGYSENVCKKTFALLVARDWLELKTRVDGKSGYRVAPSRLETAKAQQAAYRERVRAEKASKVEAVY